MTIHAQSVPAHVLVVEDNSLIATQLAMMLEDMGVDDVRLASTVGEAVAALKAHNFDLAILDLQLGDENGLAVAEHCTAADIPVIFSTGFGAELLPVIGASEQLLKKPYSMQDLERAILNAVRRVA